MSNVNQIQVNINDFLALQGYPPCLDINQFISQQWFNFSQIAFNEYRNIALWNLFKQFGIDTSLRVLLLEPI
jgi:hypothetical protein